MSFFTDKNKYINIFEVISYHFFSFYNFCYIASRYYPENNLMLVRTELYR